MRFGMRELKILNLYSGLGGNRKLWEGHQVTAIENDMAIAAAYQESFPEDRVIVADAHDYLLHHHADFDFIWSSPPCPTHGQYRYNVGFRAKGYNPVYPDMQLYEEILFLKYYYSGLWVVENVKPYYTPLVEPTTIIGRHLFWSNFPIAPIDVKASNIRSKNKISDYDEFDIKHTKIKNKRQALRNCVSPKLAQHILESIEKGSD